ncbi:MAG: universal stress protein [Myxococcales bacterium]|nr:MAG: universal stress protein [Myxococcales bacterium]
MNSPVSPSRYVVVAAIDASSIADDVLDRASGLTRAQGGELHVAHVLDPSEVAKAAQETPSREQAVRQAAHDRIDRQIKRAREQGTTVQGHLLTGEAMPQLLQLTAGLQADLLVVGTHDPSRVKRLLLGSTAESLVRKSPCPTLVVRPKRIGVDPEVIEILPPCPDCVAMQQATHGKYLWCDRHAQHHPQAHTYYEYPDGFGGGATFFKGDHPGSAQVLDDRQPE